jgi:hypothetical protein
MTERRVPYYALSYYTYGKPTTTVGLDAFTVPR